MQTVSLDYYKHFHSIQYRREYKYRNTYRSHLFSRTEKKLLTQQAILYLKSSKIDLSQQIDKLKQNDELILYWFSDGEQLFASQFQFSFKSLKIYVEKLKDKSDLQNLQKFLICFPNLQTFILEIPYQYLIDEEQAFYLREGLKMLNNLQNLSLSLAANQAAAQLLGDFLIKINKLQSIKIQLFRYQNVGEQGILKICQGIQSSKNQLKMLNLQIGYFNSVGKLGASSIANCIKQLDHLEYLNLNIKKCNDLEVNDFINIYESIQSRKLLKCLVFTSSILEDINLTSFQNLMESKENLQQLYFNLDLNDSSMISLCRSLNQFSNLQQLTIKFYRCYNIQYFFQQLGESLLHLKSLRVFILRVKQIYFEDSNFPQLLKYLKYLDKMIYFHIKFQNRSDYPPKLTTKPFYKLKRLVKALIF